VGAEWELSAGAMSTDEALEQLEDHHAFCLVVRAPMPGLVDAARRRFPRVRIVVVGVEPAAGADVALPSVDGLRDAIEG
jgi:hypothetical protein